MMEARRLAGHGAGCEREARGVAGPSPDGPTRRSARRRARDAALALGGGDDVLAAATDGTGTYALASWL